MHATNGTHCCQLECSRSIARICVQICFCVLSEVDLTLAMTGIFSPIGLAKIWKCCVKTTLTCLHVCKKKKKKNHARSTCCGSEPEFTHSTKWQIISQNVFSQLEAASYTCERAQDLVSAGDPAPRGRDEPSAQETAPRRRTQTRSHPTPAHRHLSRRRSEKGDKC